MTGLTNIMYCHTDAVEKLTKIKADSDKQLVESMQQIKDLAADPDLKAKKLAGLEAAAQAVVDVVEEGEAGDKTLVERLREAPEKTSAVAAPRLKEARGRRGGGGVEANTGW